MGVFLSYIFLGLSLAAPIGPVNAAQIDRGIKNGFWHAWLVGIGATIADAIYMLMVYFGVVHFLETPFMQTFLWAFGFFVLVYIGVESLLGINQMNSGDRNTEESRLKSFMSGFLMSLTNPITILFWLGIFGAVLAKTAATYDSYQLMLYSAAIFIGITLWDLTMACLASSFRHYLNTRLLMYISLMSGISLIGFGIYFGIHAFNALF